MLAPVLLALALATGSTPPAGVQATVECIRGRVELLADDARVHALVPGAPRSNAGTAHLEVGGGATARVSFAGRGSVRLTGPCVLEWRADAAVLVPAGEPAAVRVRFVELGSAELEARASGLALELPSGWRLEPGRSALRVERAAAGAWLALPGAGAPCAAVPPGGGRIRMLVAGRASVLAPAGGSQCLAERHAPWAEVRWPWGAR
jgi:hypothetical protein